MNPHQSPAQLYTTRPKLPLTGEALARGSNKRGWVGEQACLPVPLEMRYHLVLNARDTQQYLMLNHCMLRGTVFVMGRLSHVRLKSLSPYPHET